MINSYLLRLFTIVGFFSISFFTYGQTGTEFWFAAPEVTEGHVDEPIVVRISNISQTQDANVTIEQPANAGFAPINIVVPANTQVTEDLTPFKDDLENWPSDAVLDKGLHITSDEDITVYYEVTAVQGNNPDIFALKGPNGLGTEFYTPFQNQMNNGNYTPEPFSAIEIVATEDNTEVTITPTTDVDGHPAGTPYTIFLNRGQTYSVRDLDDDNTGGNNLSGTYITSNNPIAVTVSDDSVIRAGCRDIIGDQIVPINIVGNEYIIVRGFLDDPNEIELVTIVATEDNTIVDYTDINGMNTSGVLNAGESFYIDIEEALTFIESNNPIYTMHISGFGCEVGAALMPPLNCAGSEQIGFTRSTNEFFGINILVKAEDVGAFELNGDPNEIDPVMFNFVPGTAGEWVATRIDLTADIPVGTANTIRNNSGLFSLGTINGNATSGCRYGYFSQFAAEILVDAGPDLVVCANDSEVTLAGDVSGGATEGIWSHNSSGDPGVFSDETSFTSTYTPSQDDIDNGEVELILTSVSPCFPVHDTIRITITPPPVVDAGFNTLVCANNDTVWLAGDVSGATTTGEWTSSGSGSFFPNNSFEDAEYYLPSSFDITNGSIQLTLESTNNGSCIAENDVIDVDIDPAPIVDAGDPITVCENDPVVQLDASIANTPAAEWSGNGSFSNINNLQATYSPTQAEIDAGEAIITLTSAPVGNCLLETDDLTITIIGAPVVDAGDDLILCENNDTIYLNGSITGSTNTGNWSSDGTGVFFPDVSLQNAQYYMPSADDNTNGVEITLTSTNNGSCLEESDSFTASFTTAPSANAGTDQTVCENNPEVSINGTVQIAGDGEWSTSGTGTFTPDNSLNANTYTPSQDDINNGTVLLTLTTTDNGDCVAESDVIEITIEDAPVVDAGGTATVCENNAVVDLNGSVTLAPGGEWSGAGIFSDVNDLEGTYTPTQAEIDAGQATITLTSLPYSGCNAESDDLVITITDAPEVDAGDDVVLCANNSEITLIGSVTGITNTGMWSSDGTGVFFPDNSLQNATHYAPSQDDISNGVTITLSSTNNDNCNAVTDNFNATFTPAPIVDAGDDMEICVNNPDVSINGTVQIAGDGEWTTSGTGSFAPDNTLSADTYIPSQDDIDNGNVTLTLTSTDNGDCLEESDEIEITFTPAPEVETEDLIACVSDGSIELIGTVSGPTNTGEWSIFEGNGSFSPNAQTLNAEYNFTQDDIDNGFVILVLSSTDNGNCTAVTDTMELTFEDPPELIAGNDVEVCSSAPHVQLNGVIVSGATQAQWSTSGSGIFNPSQIDLNAVYEPSIQDINDGSVTITLTSVDGCSEVQDDFEISIIPGPEVDAGEDELLCINNLENIQLSGTVINAGGGEWSTNGNGSFTPNNTNLNTQYVPTSSDTLAGSITIYLTSTDNGDCEAVTDSIIIDFVAPPVVDAGNDQVVCSTSSSTQLQGSVMGSSGTGEWSILSGSGSFSNPTSLVTEYFIDQQDVDDDEVILILTSTNNGNCLAETDTIVITFGPSPFVDAGDDFTVCPQNPDIELDGTVSGGSTTGQWNSTSADPGIFTPSPNLLQTTYTPTQTEINQGFVELILTSTNNGDCVPGSDTIRITFEEISVDAGEDLSLCPGVNEINLSGTVTNAGGGEWTTSGNGTFLPTNTSLNPIYVVDPSDADAGMITITLSSTDNGDCQPATDEITISFDQTISGEFSYESGCVGESLSFTDETDPEDDVINSWQWDFGDGTQGSGSDVNHTYNTSGTFVVTLTINTQNGCSDVITNDVTIYNDPFADFDFAATSFAAGVPITFVDLSIGANTVVWDFGNDDSDTIVGNFSYTYDEDGVYIITQTVFNQFGCADSTTKTLVLEDAEEVYPPSMPTAFSPNGDNINDVLNVLGGPFAEIEFRVFNQWGEQIFFSTDPDIGWDGTRDGVDQPVGDYAYTVNAVTVEGKEYKVSGAISLIR